MVLSRAFLFLWILSLSPALLAQENRYMVFFKDKNGSPHSVSSPQTFLSKQAINRRTKYNITITSSDIPVTPAYVTGLNDAGADVIHTTRWMNGALVESEASLISTLEGL